MAARTLFIVLGAIVLATLALAPLVGEATIGWRDVVGRGAGLHGRLYWEFRLPRVGMACMAGAGLALAGCVFQSVFRNPLAEPFTLGVASGASLGAAIGLHLGLTRLIFGVLSPLTALAFAGAVASVAIVWTIARMRGGGSVNTLLLAGVAIGFVCAAMILLLEFLSARPVTNEIVRWLMGSVDRAGLVGLLQTIPFVAIAAAVIWYLHKSLDLLMMGELVAAGRGVEVGRTRAVAFFTASLMTAAIAAQCGPIAFVGLLMPHMMRALAGPTHRHLLPAAALAGAVFLPWCDVVAGNLLRWRSGSAFQIPVGVVTNFVGGLFFIYLLMSRREDSVFVQN